MDWLAALDQEETILHGSLPVLVAVLDWVSAFIDVAAIIVMLVGAGRFAIGFLGSEFAHEGVERVQRINAARASLGRYILAGLELFIVSDVIRVATSLKFSALVFLGVLVGIRTLISFALDREMIEIRRELE